MDVQTLYTLHHPDQVMNWLQTNVPQYSYQMRHKKFLIASTGMATGVQINITGAQSVKLMWAIPNMGVQIMMTLALVLSGILPGLVLWGIVWMATKSATERIKQTIAQALHTGQPVTAGQPQAAGAAGAYPQQMTGAPQAGALPPSPGPGGLAPGTAVMIQAPDGQGYPGTFVQAQGGQVQCRFSDGQEGWYPEGSIRPS